GDGVDPGRELRAPLPFGGPLHHAQENLLQEILRRRRVPREAAEEMPDRLLVPGKEALEGPYVPHLVGRHERLVGFAVLHREVIPPSTGTLPHAAAVSPARRRGGEAALVHGGE